MSESYATREAAMQAAMTQVLTVGEPAAGTVCVCGRDDLGDMADAERSAIMADCAQCERVLIGETRNADAAAAVEAELARREDE